MWFIAKVNFDEDSCEIINEFNEFNQSWNEYRDFLARPESVEGGALRICEARDRASAIEQIRNDRKKDIVRAALQRGTPDRVVRQWARSYGVNMDSAAKLTTDRFRGGKSREEWAAEEGKRLKELEYDPGEGKGSVRKLTVKGTEYATVLFSRTVSTREGKSKITETYTLKNVGGKWLIDEIEGSGSE